MNSAGIRCAMVQITSLGDTYFLNPIWFLKS